jgi:glutathione-regulated potassium-efflux system ancillary protein KefC
MQNVWVLASLWVGFALIATLLAIWFKISTALTEIVGGTVAPLIIGAVAGSAGLAAETEWITFLAGARAVVLTFLAGGELDPVYFSDQLERSDSRRIGRLFGPFLGCTAVAPYVLHWTVRTSWLAGVALSTTSVGSVTMVRNKRTKLWKSRFARALHRLQSLGLFGGPPVGTGHQSRG